MKIGTKLLVIFSVPILLFGIFGYIAINTSRAKLSQSLSDNSISLTVTILDKIDREIYYRIEDAEQYTKNLLLQQRVVESNKEFENLNSITDYINENDAVWIGAPKDEITPFMKNIIDNQLSNELRKKIDFYGKIYGYRIYGEIFITNRFGANLAQSGKTSDYNQADEDWWQKAKADGLYISDVEYDESSGVYSLSIGTRIDDENGNFIGVMKTVLNVEESINILKGEKRSSKYKSANFKLLSRSGRLIYDTEGNYDIFTDVSREKFFENIKNDQGFFTQLAEHNDKQELFVYTHSYGYRSFLGFGWIILAEYDADEVQAPINNLIIILAITSLFGMIVMLIFGLSIYVSITAPIYNLREAVRKIGQGNLDTNIEVKPGGEIGELASAFRQMTGDLKKSRNVLEEHKTSLEKQVTDRIKELKAKNEDLEKFNRIAVDRELKMVELKKEIKQLKEKLGS